MYHYQPTATAGISASSTPDCFAIADFQCLALDPSPPDDDSKFYCPYHVLDLFTNGHQAN